MSAHLILPKFPRLGRCYVSSRLKYGYQKSSSQENRARYVWLLNLITLRFEMPRELYKTNVRLCRLLTSWQP